MSEYAVIARGLSRQFGEFVAVDAIDFEIEKGECFGFLGPNGAGKTTTMRMIYRATPVGSGQLEIFGIDGSTTANNRRIKAHLGVVPQEDNLDQDLSVRENLEVFSRFYGVDRATRERRVEELLDFADLQAKRDELVLKLSGGMKRRLMIARGLLGEPDLLVLDEPTTGLDPRARQRIWEKLSELRRRNATLILTTHYMDEAERLCDRLAVMDGGRIVATGSPRELMETHVAKHVVEVTLGLDGDVKRVEPFLSLAPRHEVLQDRVLFYVDEVDALASRLTHELPDFPVLVRRSSLDDVFLRLTGKELDE